MKSEADKERRRASIMAARAINFSKLKAAIGQKATGKYSAESFADEIALIFEIGRKISEQFNHFEGPLQAALLSNGTHADVRSQLNHTLQRLGAARNTAGQFTALGQRLATELFEFESEIKALEQQATFFEGLSKQDPSKDPDGPSD